MKCPKCQSQRIESISTNGFEDDYIVRQRGCLSCKHRWFTVETQVNTAVIGWSKQGDACKSKPVLRVPLDLAIGREAI